MSTSTVEPEQDVSVGYPLTVPDEPNGPAVRALLRRTAIGAAIIGGVAVAVSALSKRPGTRALALGALSPGAGYVYTRNPLRFLATLGGFATSLVAWFGSGNIVAAAAGVAGGSAQCAQAGRPRAQDVERCPRGGARRAARAARSGHRSAGVAPSMPHRIAAAPELEYLAARPVSIRAQRHCRHANSRQKTSRLCDHCSIGPCSHSTSSTASPTSISFRPRRSAISSISRSGRWRWLNCTTRRRFTATCPPRSAT